MNTKLRILFTAFLFVVMSSAKAQLNVPEGTLTISMRNDNNGVWIQGADLSSFKIDNSNNFVGHSNCEFALIPTAKNLSEIVNVPRSGWAKRVAVRKNVGYVIRFTRFSDQDNYLVTPKVKPTYYYLRLFVDDWMTNVQGEIIGAQLFYAPMPETIIDFHPAMKRALLNNEYKVDLNDDGEISTYEAAYIHRLELSGVGPEAFANDVLKYFPGVVELYMNNNDLDGIDLCGNPNLEILHIRGNNMESLNLTCCPRVYQLEESPSVKTIFTVRNHKLSERFHGDKIEFLP